MTTVLTAHGEQFGVVTDWASALAKVIEDLTPAALHTTGRYQDTPDAGDPAG